MSDKHYIFVGAIWEEGTEFVNFLYIYSKTKILIRLNIFRLRRFSGKFKFTIRQEDIPKSLTVHYLLENLSNINPKIKKLSKHKQTLY